MLYIVTSSHLTKWLSGINEYEQDLGKNLIYMSPDGTTGGDKRADPVDPIVYAHGNRYNRIIYKVGNIGKINVYVDYMFAPGQVLAVDGQNDTADMLDHNDLGDPRKYVQDIIVRLHPEYAAKKEESSEEDQIMEKKRSLDKLVTLPTDNNMSMEDRIRLARNM